MDFSQAPRAGARTHSLIPILATLVLCVFSSGCRTDIEAKCETLVRAIRYLSHSHLNSGTVGFERPQFERAEAELLKRYGVPTPAVYRTDAITQCGYVTAQIHRKNGQKSIDDLLVELLNYYVREWDPHSSAMSESEYASESSLYRGYGFATERTMAPQRFEIVEVIAGSPAHDAGLQKGALILSVNGQYVRDKSSTEFAALIDSNDTVKLGVSSAGVAYREVVLRRRRFEVSPVKFRTYQDGTIGYLKLRTLVGAEAVFAEALQTLSSSRALIVDLRDLRGGSVQTASTIADWLTSATELFGGLLDQKRQLSTLKFQRTTSLWDGPIVVLVNGNTMSAGELLAGSLQDYGAVVVGQRTFGKGTRQSFKSLTNFGFEAGVYLTDAFVVRPSGKLIQFTGITPNVTLPAMSEPETRETSLHGALAAPPNLNPLAGYDVSTLPTQSRSVRKGLAQLESQLRVMIETGELGRTEEDQQIEAAKRIALFLAAQAEGTDTPAQIELPFTDE